MAQAAWGTPPSRLGKKQQQPSNLTGTHMMPLAQAAWGTPPSHLGTTPKNQWQPQQQLPQQQRLQYRADRIEFKHYKQL